MPVIPAVPHATYQDFRDTVLGRWYDLDGLHGAQCWDGVDLLYQQSDINRILSTNNTGLAKNCWLDIFARTQNSAPPFIPLTHKSDIKRGDIIVFNTYSGWYGTTGHIAFADEDYRGTDYINILGQNQGEGSNPDTGKAFNIWEAYLGSAFLGIFRYTVWNTPPEPEESKKKKKKYPFVIAKHDWKMWG